jgi:hypothetical protein
MLTPKELYESYSTEPCSEQDFFNNNPLHGTGKYGKGTPHYMRRVVQFMKHLRYPCISNAPNYSSINNAGLGQLSLTYKFLESLDSECLKETQPTIKSGTSHSIRNSCDISRACYLITNNNTSAWEHRMATEYLQHFGQNSLSDCLMVLGPDLVSSNFAYYERAPNVGEMSCLPIEKDGPGATGATWSCMEPPFALDPKPECRSCPYCELLPDGTPINPDDPCCKFSAGSVDYQNLCCGAPLTTRIDFSILLSTDIENNIIQPNTIRFIPIDNFDILEKALLAFWLEGSNRYDNSVDIDKFEAEAHWKWISGISVGIRPGGTSPGRVGNRPGETMKINDAIALLDGKIYVYSNPNFEGASQLLEANRLGTRWDRRAYNEYIYKMKHIGILPRKIYEGYANFLDNSGENFYGIIDDMFIDYFQQLNQYNYDDTPDPLTDQDPLSRARTISMINSDPNIAIQEIKGLLWNGYGIILFSNIGFSNTRDSKGISYPDRMWYTTYSIIGYDDTLTEYDECVYILHCPWGKWNNGGQPYWGELPDGAFLVKEQHLKCMLKVYADRDYYNCRNQLPCNPVLDNCEDPAVIRRLSGCGEHGPAEKCEPYFCASQQRAMGLAFAISLSEGFPSQFLDHNQWIPKQKFTEKIEETTLYYSVN